MYSELFGLVSDESLTHGAGYCNNYLVESKYVRKLKREEQLQLLIELGRDATHP